MRNYARRVFFIDLCHIEGITRMNLFVLIVNYCGGIGRLIDAYWVDCCSSTYRHKITLFDVYMFVKLKYCCRYVITR